MYIPDSTTPAVLIHGDCFQKMKEIPNNAIDLILLFDTFQFMVRHKTNPVPNIRKSSFLNSCELIVCLWNKGHTWNFSTQNQMHNFIETPICMGKERIKYPKHPTQKPLAVLEHIIRIASKESYVRQFIITASAAVQ